MAEHLGRKRPKMPEDGSPHGCIGSLFNFLDFHQRLHIGKMLAYNKSTLGKQAERTKSPKVKQDVSTPEKQQFMDKDSNVAGVPVENKGTISRNNSGKVLMRSLYSKRRHSEHDVNQHVSPLTTQLLRTFSIHHLDSNDFVGSVAHNTVNITAAHNSHESGTSINREHIHLLPKVSDGHSFQKPSEPHGTLNTVDYVGQTKLNRLPDHLLEKHSLLREKLSNAHAALLKKKTTDAKEFEQDAESNQSKELLDMMVFLNNNRELLLKILKDPGSYAKFLESKQTSSAERVLTMAPVAGDSGRISSSFESSNMISSSCELKDQRENQWDNRTASSHFKVIKKRIKDVIKHNRKEGLRISMDGVLHKIPYGSKLSKDVNKEKQGLLEKPSTTRYDRENSGSKSMKRSHSLNESLDKYSRLLESISSTEFKRTPEKDKLKQEDSGGSRVVMPQKTLGRIFSLPEFDSNLIPTTVDIFDTGDCSKGLTEQDSIQNPLHNKEFSNEDDQSDWLSKTHAVTDFELYFPENFVSPAEFSASETFKELDASDQFEGSIADSERLQVPDEFDDYFNFFNVQVDRQNEARFNYVRDILWKSGFASEEFLRAWYSPNQPVDPLLFEETECTVDEPEIFLESQLLFDLINEALLEIYDTSSSCCPWLSRFDTRTRPMPAGYHVLEEVWANISWNLSSQLQVDLTLDHAVARDFAKNDGWMEIQYDCEDVGLELEVLILDELLDEVVLELGNVQGP